MEELAREMPGFLGIESVRGEDGRGITISYWESEDDIRCWKEQFEHVRAQEAGRSTWYEADEVKVARVERAYGFIRDPSGSTLDDSV